MPLWLLLVSDLPGASQGAIRCLQGDTWIQINFHCRREDYCQKRTCYLNEARECPVFPLSREFGWEVVCRLCETELLAFFLTVTKSQEKEKKAKQRVAWMRLVCHGNSVYFTDLHLDCPTSSLYSCGSLLASLSSLILFQSETAFMLLIFALSVSKPEMLCHWQTTIWSSGATHTTLGIANALTAAPPRWARGV